jgi:aquaporin Z
MTESAAGTAVTTTAADPTPAHKLSAEVAGTFVLVFFGVGTALATGGEVITTGFAFGLTVLVMVYSVGRISGGHFNPAVTVGAACGGRLAWAQVPAYLGAQLVGAILGAAVLWTIWQGIPGFSSEGNFGQNAFGDESGLGISWWAAFLVEVVTTLVFLVAILAVTDERNEHPALAPLAIGFTLAMIHFTTIPLTGTSVNPARSIGPALFAGGDAIIQLWLFILAPLIGGALAGLLYPALFGRHSEPVAGSGLRFGGRTPAGAVPGYGEPDAYQQQWNQQYPQGQAPPPGQPWPPEAPQQWQQPQYPTALPPQSWPQQPPQQQPPQKQPPAQPPQAAPYQQPWPGNDDDGQTQVRPPT